MLKIVKYIGRDKDEPDWDEGPFETQAEADRAAKQESLKFPRALFSIEDDDRIITYWWKGAQRTEREIEVRRRNHQWSY